MRYGHSGRGFKSGFDDSIQGTIIGQQDVGI
jgi:hypothetical protein